MALGALVVGGACRPSPSGEGGGRGRGHSRAPVDSIEFIGGEYRPSSPGAERYGDSPAHQLNPAEKWVLQGLAGRRNTHDPALSLMTRELAVASPDRYSMPPALVDGLLAWAGLVDPPPSLIVVEVPASVGDCAQEPSGSCQAPLQALVDEVFASVPDDPGIVFGIGVAEGPTGVRMIVSHIERMAQVDPLPSSASIGTNIQVRGRLLGARQSPRLEVTDGQGRVQGVPAAVGGDGGFAATVRCDRGRGAYQVELLADGAHGPEVAANFPVHCGIRRPPVIEYEVERLAADISASDVERANFEYLNLARQARGLPPLKWDPKAAEVARAHSRDMIAAGFVGHVSPTTGDVTQRFARAGVEGVVIRENVARGYGPKGMHDSLMNSPGHRVNLLAEDVTHVGIGAVFAEEESEVPGAMRPIFLTQNFYRPPGVELDIDVDAVVLEAVARQRKAAGLDAIQRDPRLDRIAREVALELASGAKPTAAFQDDVFALGYQGVERHAVQASDHSALPGLAAWKAPMKGRKLGYAIVPVKDDRGRSVGLLLVVLLADR